MSNTRDKNTREVNQLKTHNITAATSPSLLYFVCILYTINTLYLFSHRHHIINACRKYYANVWKQSNQMQPQSTGIYCCTQRIRLHHHHFPLLYYYVHNIVRTYYFTILQNYSPLTTQYTTWSSTTTPSHSCRRRRRKVRNKTYSYEVLNVVKNVMGMGNTLFYTPVIIHTTTQSKPTTIIINIFASIGFNFAMIKCAAKRHKVTELL